MFICCDCGLTFSEPGRAFDRVGERYSDGYYISTCPHCGSTEIEEAEECICCNDLKLPSEINYGLCDDCKEEIMQGIYDGVMETYRNNPEIRTWIAEELFAGWGIEE